MKTSKKNKKNNKLGVLVFVGFLSFADLGAQPALNLKGFGGAGLLTLSEDLDLVEYGDLGKKVNLSKFYNLGLNASSTISQSLRMQGQFSTSFDGYEYTPKLDWGFVSWEFTKNLSLRFGRIILPIWLYSQQIDVGYNYPWAALPIEVYGLNPLKSSNGLSILFQSNLGSGYLSAEIFGAAGKTKFSGKTLGFESQTIIDFRDSVGATLTYSLFDDALMLNAAYSQANMDAINEFTYVAGTGFFEDLDASLPAGTPYDISADAGIPSGRFYSFGGKFDLADIVVAGEIAGRFLQGQNLSEAKAFYLTGGYRFGSVLPLVTYSKLFGLEGQGFTHPIRESILLGAGNQVSASTLTFGLNFSFSDSVVLKTEASKVNQTFENTATNLDFWAFKVKTDFVF
jgi:hypothetical protein